MPKKFDVEKYNNKLEVAGQSLRLIHSIQNEFKLSNGIILTEPNEILRCKRRVDYPNYVSRFDRIYGLDKKDSEQAVSEAKSITCRIGGQNCYKKYRAKNLIIHNETHGPWNKGIKIGWSWNKGLTKDTHQSLKKLSDERKGSGNPMFGIDYPNSTKKKQSKTMREKILSGEFTPQTNNRNTHWDTIYCGQKYRSSWEALYQYHYPNHEYEKLRIKYLYNGKQSVYIVDFICYTSKVVIEIKPKSITKLNKKFHAKLAALNEWAIKHDFRVMIFDIADLIALGEPHYEHFDAETERKIRNAFSREERNRKTK